MDSNYTPYHLHSKYSLLDSTTDFKKYIDKAKDLGMIAIGFSEHGNIFNWIKKKQYCDEVGIKYMHGVEMYLTQNNKKKRRDNYHTILYAKNWDGVKELNNLVEISGRDDHKYYKPRISFDEFLGMSDNIISISACLASPLNKLDFNNSYYEKLVNKYDYLEIQPHHKSDDQIDYNIKLLMISDKYDKKLILGTDTHEIDAYKQECRSILKKAKNMSYDNEDDFNLTFREFDGLMDECRIQNCFDMHIYEEAIENTNRLADSIDEFELSYEFKYPKLYSDDELEYKKTIKDKLDYKIKNNIIDTDKMELYLNRLQDEFDAFKKQGMFSYMLFMSELCTWCWDNNIPVGFGRGSCTGSVASYILDITDVDPVRWNTIFSRFVNEERISLADIDVDFAPKDREMVYNYIINRFGEDFTSYIITFNSISEKGTISEIARALDYDFETSMRIKSEFEENEELCRNSYKELFYYYNGLIGTYVSSGVHPAGMIASPISIKDNVGIHYDKGLAISQCDMKAVDSLNYVKFDILSLKNIGIIKETCRLLGCEYKKSHEVDWNDSLVWKDIISSPAGIFQFEGNYAHGLLSKFKPTKIDDMSLINASLRPSGESYRDAILEREFYNNPTKEIDELLKNNYGRLVYQEDQIRFLQEICGFTGGMADNVRRAIGKKDEKLLATMLPKVKEGYIENSKKPREIAEKEVEQFLQVLSDSSDYAFGYNHSTAYSMIGYVCGWLRYYHPIEFTTAFFNMAKDENDIQMGEELGKLKNIKINPITFGASSEKYDIKDGEIYKGMESVKYINATIPEELNSLFDKNLMLPELIQEIKDSTSVNSRQLMVLVKIGYFKKYGSIKRILNYLEWIETFKNKTFKKIRYKFLFDYPEYYGVTCFLHLFNEDIEYYLDGCCEQTAKMYKELKKLAIFEKIWYNLEEEEIEFTEKVKNEIMYLGYVSSEIPKNITVASAEMVSFKNKSVNLKSYRNGQTKWFKIGKGVSLPIKGDIMVIPTASMITKKGWQGRKDIHIMSYKKIDLK